MRGSGYFKVDKRPNSSAVCGLTTDALDEKINNSYRAGIDRGIRAASRIVLDKAVLEFRAGIVDRADDFRVLADFIIEEYENRLADRLDSELVTGIKKQS